MHPTMKSGKPTQVAKGEKQLDGSRTPTFSPPVRKPGLAPRQAVPDRPSDSGIERAMQAEADRIHR